MYTTRHARRGRMAGTKKATSSGQRPLPLAALTLLAALAGCGAREPTAADATSTTTTQTTLGPQRLTPLDQAAATATGPLQMDSGEATDAVPAFVRLVPADGQELLGRRSAVDLWALPPDVRDLSGVPRGPANLITFSTAAARLCAGQPTSHAIEWSGQGPGEAQELWLVPLVGGAPGDPGVRSCPALKYRIEAG